MNAAPAVSVVLSTFDRARELDGALASLAAQEGGVPYEVVVVDNASTDATREVVAGWAARTAGRIRYLYEGRPGVSFGRNAGIAAARAEVTAFTDDDVRPEPGWVAAIARVMEERPGVGFVGGEVVPVWPTAPPRWLTEAHWPPLGVTGYGARPFSLEPSRPVALLTACLAVRRRAFARVGLFSPRVQRVGGGIGSVEDEELVTRLLRAGIPGRYDPRLRVLAPVAPERMTRRYHRRWHAGHGRSRARLHDPVAEASALRILGVPGHLVRGMMSSAAGWVGCTLRGDPARAFLHETRLHFAAGFVRERLSSRGRDPAPADREAPPYPSTLA